MLSNIIDIFIDTAFFVFEIIVMLQINKAKNFNFFRVIIAIIYNYNRLIMMTAICHKLTTKFKKTGEIIYDLIPTFEDPEIKEEVMID